MFNKFGGGSGFYTSTPRNFKTSFHRPMAPNFNTSTFQFNDTPKSFVFGFESSGTVIKFVPVQLIDTAVIKGINQTINGRNQCITCMKEYADKSLEELRWEDYQANRKGPQVSPFFIDQNNNNNNNNNNNSEPMVMEPEFGQLNKNLFDIKFASSNAPSGLFGKPVQSINQTAIFNRNTSTQQSVNQNTKFSFGISPTPTTSIGQSTSVINKPNKSFKYNPITTTTTPQIVNQQPPQTQTINQSINQPNHDRILSMSSNPYGLSDLLNNIKEIDNIIKESSRATNPQQLNILLKTVENEVNKKCENVLQIRKVDQGLFDGLTNENHRNPKKLVLKKFVTFEKMTAATPPENPSGIILTRPEYYTIPPIQELKNSNGLVQGFTVGRRGYGNVYFPETLNVSNLNLDDLIHFSHKEIIIYPDDRKKPPRGEGLNRPAQITLDNVWPIDKNTQKYIKDVEILTEMKYAERLRRLCERQQTIYVDYRPATGSWVFKVEHFSKYGDEDDDDDDDIFFDDFTEINFEEFHSILCDDVIEDIPPAANELIDLPYMVPLKNSYFNHFKIFHDCAAFKGRCFKIGWSVKMTYFTLTQVQNTRENSIQINQIQFTRPECLQEHFEIQLNNSQFIENKLISNPDLLKFQENCKCFNGDIWRLCSALWGENDYTLTTWLQNVLPTTSEQVKDESILKYLSLYQIENAAKYALDHNYPNLSTLISQLPSNQIIRKYLLNQFIIWKNMSDLIDDDLLKIYLLIAGIPEICFGNKTISIFDGMNWLQIYAIYLWYINNPEHPANGFLLYETEQNDLRFHLLKYYSDNKYPISNILNPANILDLHVSWFLLQILESLNFTSINPKTKQFIHLNFAAHLEQIQEWHWAIFVLLFLDDFNLKTILIQDIIGRNIQLDISSEYIKKENFLLQLKIPSHWIENAKATYALNLGKIQEAICYLSYAEKYQEAYDYLMDLLLPNNFFSYDYEFLLKILEPFSTKNLPNWEQNGGLIMDFAKLGMEHNSHNMENDRLRFRSSVVNIHTRFRDISDLNYIRHVSGLAGRNWSVLDHLLN